MIPESILRMGQRISMDCECWEAGDSRRRKSAMCEASKYMVKRKVTVSRENEEGDDSK